MNANAKSKRPNGVRKFRDITAPVIALMWNGMAVYAFGSLMLSGNETVKDTIENVLMLILGYFFGSTRAQNEKMREQSEK